MSDLEALANLSGVESEHVNAVFSPMKHEIDKREKIICTCCGSYECGCFGWCYVCNCCVSHCECSTYVSLSQGLVAIIDKDDVPVVIGQKWHAVKSGKTKTFYAVNSKNIAMHRLLLDASNTIQVDHKNGNGLDNRRTNIRLATCAQNQHNAVARKNGSSIYKGVYWRRERKKWSVRIKNNGLQYSLGCFQNEVEAALVFDEAARVYHGEYACVNFPLLGERSAL